MSLDKNPPVRRVVLLPSVAVILKSADRDLGEARDGRSWRADPAPGNTFVNQPLGYRLGRMRLISWHTAAVPRCRHSSGRLKAASGEPWTAPRDAAHRYAHRRTKLYRAISDMDQTHYPDAPQSVR